MNATFAVLAVLVASGQDAGVKFKLAESRKAKESYETAIKKLDQDYMDKYQELNKKYKDELEAAKKVALAANDLDESERIATTVRNILDADKIDRTPGFRIVAAAWGHGSSFADVTLQIQKLSKSGRLAIDGTTDFPDPAPNKSKTLVVVYRNRGRIYVQSAQEVETRLKITVP